MIGDGYENDGNSEDYPPPPGWRELLNAQAVRLGWMPAYRKGTAA